jgi:dipeptidyl aminopeptidase/acylaminoacyl peptidase
VILSRLSPLILLSLLFPAAVFGQAGDPIREFLGETLYDEVRVSPNGRHVAFIVKTNDFEKDREDIAIWLADPGRPGSEPVRVTRQPGGYSSLQWSPDNRLLSFLWTDEATGASQIHVLDPAGGGEPRRLTDPERFGDGIFAYEWLPDGSGVLFLARDEPDEAALAEARRVRELYGDVRRLPGPRPESALYRLRVSPSPGRAERVAELPFEIAGGLAVSPDGGWAAISGFDRSELLKTSEVLVLPLGPQAVAPRQTRNLAWEEIVVWAGADPIVAKVGEEGPDGRFVLTEAHLHRLDSAGRLTPAAPDLQGYVLQIVPLADGSVLTTTSVSTRIRVSKVEPSTGRATRLYEHPGWLFALSASRDGGRVAFVASDSRHFPEVYVADGLDSLGKARPLTSFNAARNRGPLPEIEVVSWDNGEGDKVEGVLFWPPGRKGEKGLPLIVDLHGGPISVARTEAVALFGAFMSYPALLASRGFLVLNPNYRGSAGRGDTFARAVQERHCSRPATDVITGAESLIARGWADRNRAGIIGYSYGGVVTNCTITRTDLFRAAATGAGSWDNLSRVVGSQRGGSWAETFYGGKLPWEAFDLYWEESPVSRANRVRTPTLAIAGDRDGTAPAQAQALFWSLSAAGTPVELLLFPGEGHVFRKPSHKLTKVRAEISWLEHHLLGKPRAESSIP